MLELDYPVGHPKNRDFKGVASETQTSFSFDYPRNHPARGGQGQPVVVRQGTENEPWDGHKHLHGLEGDTLIERQREFARLSKTEQEAREKWNKEGIPADAEEE